MCCSRCEAALATAKTGAIAAEMGAVEIVHYGTYNCRPIAGTSTLSQHAFANAIDLYGFTLDSGPFYTVSTTGRTSSPTRSPPAARGCAT